MRGAFLKTFGIALLSLWIAFAILVGTIFYQDGHLSGWALFFAGPAGVVFIPISAIIALVIASIVSFFSRNQAMQTNGTTRSSTGRIALYTILVVLVLFVGFLKFNGL